MSTTQQLRALVLRAPGINCDRETAQACRMVGFETDLVHINQLIKDPASLLTYQFLVFPGGFSYGDDLGAGTLLAKNLEIHLGEQLRQFVAEGRPVLGICNGFQVLIRLGLLPGKHVNEVSAQSAPANTKLRSSLPISQAHALEAELASASEEMASLKAIWYKQATLTENESAQFECRWVKLAAQPGPCIFTRSIERTLELPVAHGEGQFVLAGDVSQLQANGQVPLIYVSADGRQGQSASYPDNPNGSVGDVAGVCNTRGNVLGLMPHPERYVTALQHPQRRSLLCNGLGDGILLFQNAYTYAQQLQQEVVPTSGPALQTEQSALSYASSGVDIAAGEEAVRLMKDAVRATQGAEVLAGIGAFAGIFSGKSLSKMLRPALVASTDGVGTKTVLATQAGRYDTIGYDIVNHSVNDLLMQGARPLFFMDYIAMGRLDPTIVATIVKGIAHACRDAGCALLGGETAEMPDVYLPDTFDLAGTIVGVVEENEIINGSTIIAGDVILGLASNGLHTNGYSLARRVFAPYPLDTVFPELGEPLSDALLRPHRSYLREITQLKDYLADRRRYIKGMAHITGGGFTGNISRILPAGRQAVINTGSWQIPPLFQLIARLGNIPHTELYQTFNMGIGAVIVLSPKSAIDARCILPNLLTIGSIQGGHGVVIS
jgi:phosphoribosylformylglycinamidine synthase I